MNDKGLELIAACRRAFGQAADERCASCRGAFFNQSGEPNCYGCRSNHPYKLACARADLLRLLQRLTLPTTWGLTP